jgi:hypothetical protein
MNEIKEFAMSLQEFARPYLTILIATLFNVLLACAYFMGDLSIVEYITAVGPTNGMIIGFWFGERAALKDPKGAKDDSRT